MSKKLPFDQIPLNNSILIELSKQFNIRAVLGVTKKSCVLQVKCPQTRKLYAVKIGRKRSALKTEIKMI